MLHCHKNKRSGEAWNIVIICWKWLSDLGEMYFLLYGHAFERIKLNDDHRLKAAMEPCPAINRNTRYFSLCLPHIILYEKIWSDCLRVMLPMSWEKSGFISCEPFLSGSTQAFKIWHCDLRHKESLSTRTIEYTPDLSSGILWIYGAQCNGISHLYIYISIKLRNGA